MATNLYRLYIDESGDHTYGRRVSPDSSPDPSSRIIRIWYDKYPELEHPQKRYLCLTGCVVQSQFYSTEFSCEMEELKKRHFTYDPSQPLIFHREDIVHKRYSFSVLKDPKRQEAFNGDLLSFLRAMEYTIISVVIDKKTHIQQYRDVAFHPYHYCLKAMLERYCGFLHFFGARGDVLAESRGRADDEKLKESYREFYSGGSEYCPKERCQGTLTSKEINLKKSTENEAGLQLSDLLAHPVKHNILSEFGRLPKRDDFGARILDIIESKFNRQYYSGKVRGYGKVFLNK